MPAEDDEFAALLERCRERLGEIKLDLPQLDDGTPRPAPLSLTPPPARLPPSAAPAAPAPMAAEPELPDVFPPADLPSAPAPRPAAETPRPAAVAGAAAKPRRWLAAAWAGLALAVAAVWYLAQRPATEIALDVPGADALAVEPDGTLLIAADRELVSASAQGRVLSRAPLDAPVRNLCWDEGTLWSVDGRAAAVVARRRGAPPTSFRLNHVPRAVYVRDKYLWTVADDGRSLHQFLVSRSILGVILQSIDTFSLPSVAAAAFAVDDAGIVWLVDADSRRLLKLRQENAAYKISAYAPLSPVLGPEAGIRGFQLSGRRLWLLARPGGAGRTRLLQLAPDGLRWSVP